MNKSISENVSELVEYYKQYIQLRLKKAKISISEKFIDAIAGITFGIVFWFILLFVLIFLGFSFAFWYGEKYGNLSMGFLITAGIYLLLGCIFYLLRKPLIFDPLARKLSDVLEIENLEDEKEEEE